MGDKSQKSKTKNRRQKDAKDAAQRKKKQVLQEKSPMAGIFKRNA